MRGVYYSACSLCYNTIAHFHQKSLLMRDCLLFRRLLLPESTVFSVIQMVWINLKPSQSIQNWIISKYENKKNIIGEILETFWHDWKKSRGLRNHNRKHFCRKNNWDSSRWLKPWVSNVEPGWNAAGMPRFLEKSLL